MNTKTTFNGIEASEREWHLVDASGLPIGRLASELAQILRGKHKPQYAPHLDVGDHVVVINAGKIAITSKKPEQKMYHSHSGYPGGIKSITAKKVLEGKNPDRLVRLAVKRMIPSGPLGRKQLSNMKVYVGSNHPHEAQNPKSLNIKELI